jgi:hypothetical protein
VSQSARRFGPKPAQLERDCGVIVDDRHARPLLSGAVEDIVALIGEPAERNARAWS